MDYEQESRKLDQGSEVWKPGVGSHKVLIMSEPELTEFEDDKGKVIPQIKLRISVDKEMRDWFVGVGSTSQSAYGQLIQLGRVKGKLSEEIITVIVNQIIKKDGGTRNSYTIPEAIEAIKSLQEEAVVETMNGAAK